MGITGLGSVTAVFVFLAIATVAGINFPWMLLIIILMIAPPIYAIEGAIGGAISAAIYNTFARFLGGIEVEVREIPE